MSLFNDKDTDVIDSEVLKRIIKFANQTSGDLSHAAEDIETLKNDIKNIKEDMQVIKIEVAHTKILWIVTLVVILFQSAMLVWLFFARFS